MAKPTKRPAKKSVKKSSAARKASPPIPDLSKPVPEDVKSVPQNDTLAQLVEDYERKMAALLPQRARFVEEFIVDLNPTAAAIRASYSKHTADRQSSRLLKYADVKAAVNAGRAVISERNKDRFEEAMAELRLVAFSNIEHYVTVDPDTGAVQCKGFEDMPHSASKAIESIQEDRVIRESPDGKQIILNDKRKFKLHDKVKALVAYIDRLKPPEQKLNVTVSGLTMFPPEPKTMEEYEKIVRSGNV